MIKKLTKNDFDLYYSIYFDERINPFLMFDKTAKNKFKKDYLKTLKIANLYGFFIKGKLVGVVGFRIGKGRSSHTAYIAPLAVLPEYQKKGIATKLMKFVEKKCKAKGIKKLWLDVVKTAKPAYRLYKKLGYKKEGTQKAQVKIHGKYLDCILMAKFLR